MRIHLTIFVIALAFFNVSAKVLHAQTITLKAKNIELKAIFNEIEKQTGYLFWYDNNLLKNASNVDVNLKDASLKEALDACLKDQPLEYSINDRTIVVKAREKGFFDRIKEAFRTINVTGKVLDENSQPLIGASVKVKGTGRQTTSDNQGAFFFDNVAEDAVVEISFLGYVTQEVKAQKSLTIRMTPATSSLNEVQVNAGYYKVSNKERTGSISRVDGKTISQQPVSNPLAALIGRMPGVNIEQQSGLNGGGFKIEIRGQNSLRNTATDNGNNPLYLINGIPFPSASLTDAGFAVVGISNRANPLNSINPHDIESIEILKDADATAIYGSRGANGVVLITTKRAKAGSTSYEINVQQGISVISKKLNLMDAEEYFAMRSQAFKNDGVSPNATQYDVNGTWDQSRYTDWQKELIGGTAESTNISAAIRGGNEQTQFSISGNYNRQSTVFPVDFADQKAAGSLSISHQSLNKKFTAVFATTLSFDNNKLPKSDFTQYIMLPPNAPALYDEQGNLNWGLNSSGATTWTNPVSTSKQPYIAKTGNLLSSAQLAYEIVPGLSLKTDLGYTSISLKERMQQPIASFPPVQGVTGSNRIRISALDIWSIEPQLTYHKEIGHGTFNIIAGSTFQSTSQESETLLGSGYTSDLLLSSITSAPTRTATNTSSIYKYAALFGRINYNYKSTYIVNITGRRDGSSRFGPGKQFASFGAIGAAWVFTNNSFIKKSLPVLSYGKLRASYGVTGSDQIPDYGYLETYAATNPYVDGSGLFPSQLANPDYSWEANKKIEASIDLGFIKDKILFTASWYRNRSSNQLVGYKLPDITGFASIQYNLPATVQNTGLEFELNTTNMKRRAFSWSSSVNLTIPKNKLISYPGIEGSSYANTYTVGASLYQQRKYRYLGVDPVTGVYKFQDVNGNNVLDAGDRQASRKAYTSHWYGGFQNSLNYKGISLDIFFQFVSKTVQNPFVNGLGSLPGTMNNQPREVLNRWQMAGDVVDFAKFSQNFVAGGAGESFSQLLNSDRYLDASFIRLKNVSVYYTLSEKFIKKIKLSHARIFMQAQNLLTITNYPGDPEVAELRSLPTLRTVTAGFSVGL